MLCKKNDKIEQRAGIKYLFKRGLTTKQIHNDITETLGESGRSYTNVNKNGCWNLSVDESP